MSDDTVAHNPDYRYSGLDRFSFAADDLMNGPEETGATDDCIYSEEQQDSVKLEETVTRLLQSVRRVSCAGTAHTMMYSSAVNSLCGNILDSIEKRIEMAAPSAIAEIETNVKIIATSQPTQKQTFPRGPRLSTENWEKLYALLMLRLDRYGCIITQRDRKSLSETSGIEVSPYVWSTLIQKLGLRKVKNPYSSSPLVIYVPRRNR